jgi:hypothetical protein
MGHGNNRAYREIGISDGHPRFLLTSRIPASKLIKIDEAHILF